MIKRIFFICIFLLLTNTSYSSNKTKKILINRFEITFEIADTNVKRSKGLMYRKELAKNKGMLFIHENSDYYSYWMKNCFIKLDMIFLNEEKKVVHIFKDVPPCKNFFCRSYRTPIRAKYVMELPAGMANKIAIHIGQKIKFQE